MRSSIDRSEMTVSTQLSSVVHPIDGLTVGVVPIDGAAETLDLQYYRWGDDVVGALLLDRLLEAADRGFDVRLLLDDLRLWRLTPRMASLDLSLDGPVVARLGEVFQTYWASPPSTHSLRMPSTVSAGSVARPPPGRRSLTTRSASRTTARVCTPMRSAPT